MATRMTPSRAKRIFDRLNHRYFDGELERPRIVLVPAGMQGQLVSPCAEWSAVAEDPQNPGQYLMELRRQAYDFDLRFFVSTILHEMAHLSVGIEHQHDREWRQEIRRISELGALREVL